MTEREIFFEALEMSTPEMRAAYVQGACGGSDDLRRKVDELLKEHYANDSLLAGPALDGSRPGIAEYPSGEAPAQMIGRYKLLEKIGEGGFGEVWMAEQREPVKRRLALKIIKLGMDSRQVVARFEAERQALAMMDHANIARIFDAGVTDTGRPYFVMELVRGIKITEYCDQNQLPTRDRLRLFILVCHAIQHAHQKGVIHRDIKPSNILVTLHDGVPVPKVIDFGIAKATQQDLTDKTVFTQFQQFIGTPAYISPEQAEMSGLDIDTRADIYSLGVLLYELLVGQTPFDAKEMMMGGLDVLRQIIREHEPLRPSTRLNTLQGDARTTAGKCRQTEVGKLVSQLQGDLDWIVLKCLEKDRTHRYETANGLAMDIQRHMNNEPVLARSPSAMYQIRKFVRRNRTSVLAAAAVILTLCLGLVGTILGLIQARTEALSARSAQDAATQDRDRANTARQHADQAQREERRLNFQMAFDRGLALCDQGNVGSGMLWLARALELAPPEESAMQRVIRANLTAWQRELHILQAIYPHKQGIETVRVSPDGTLVLTGAIDGAVQLRNRRTGNVRELKRHYAEVHEALFSPDGETFLTASVDKTARLWDTKSGHVIREFPHGSAVWSALFTRDGLIITSNSEGQIHLWDRTKEKPIQAWRHTRHGVHDLSLSPDGTQLLGACDDGLVLLWNLQTQKIIARFAGHVGRVPTAVFVGPSRVASGGADGNLFLWSWPQAGPADAPVNGERIGQAWQHRGGIHRVRVSEDGRKLLTASFDNTAQLIDSQTGKPVGVPFEHQGGLKGVAFARDGSLFTACEGDGAREWRPAPGSLLARPFVNDAGTEQALYTPDAKYVLIREDKTASIRKALTGEQIGMPFQPEGGVHAFAISRDESIALTGAGGGKVQFWETATGSPFGVPFKHSGGAWAVAISSDGEQAVSGGQDGGVTLWMVKTGRSLRILPSMGNAPIRGVAFSPDGSRIAVANADKLAWIVGTALGDVPQKLEGHHGLVTTVAFSPDGKRVVTGSWDKTVVIWDAETGLPVSKPMRHGGPFWYAVSFSGDGRTVVAGCDDRNVRIWDIATARPIGPLLPHDAALRAAVFTQDDSQIITGTSTGATYNWDVSRSPLEGDVGTIVLWLQVSTGMELRTDGEVRPLEPESWEQRRRRLINFGRASID
jgi:WD40 repeat protein/serine/threonine protein kinase